MKKLLSLFCLLAICVALLVPTWSLSAAQTRLGDVNGDESVDMKDTLVLRRHIAHMTTLTDLKPADVNGDSSVDMKDVLILRQYIAHIIDKLPGEDVSETSETSGTSATSETSATTKPTEESEVSEPFAPFLLKTMQPDQVTLSFYDKAATQIGVTWHTTKAAADSVLQYVKVTEGEEPNFEAAEQVTAVNDEYKTQGTYFDQDVNDFFVDTTRGLFNMTDYVHHAVLEGLDYASTYAYRVGDKTAGVWSDTYTFKTREEEVGDFSFVFLSDTQAGSLLTHGVDSYMHNTLTGAATVDPDFDFIVHGGDIVELSKYLHQWQMTLNGNKDFLTKYPFMAATGNHEANRDTAGEYESYKHTTINLPETGDKKYGLYYSFDYGNAHFTVLNTCYNATARAGAVDSTQKDWAEQDLKNSDAKWKIVILHVPMVSYKKVTLTQLNGMFLANGVDLVLQADEHVYLRSYPIDADKQPIKNAEKRTIDGVEYMVNPQGVVYTTTATGGDSQAKVNANSLNADCLEYYGNGQQSTWASISITDNTLTMKTYAYNGGNFSTYSGSFWGIIKEDQ